MALYNLKHGEASLSDLKDGLMAAGIPVGKYSDVFFFDPVNGNNAANGKTPQTALKTLTMAFSRCTGDQNDVVVMINGDTADNPAAAINWNKDFTHLIGVSARCREWASDVESLVLPPLTWRR